MFFWSPIIVGLLIFLFLLFILFGIMGNREGWESLERFADANGLTFQPGDEAAPAQIEGRYKETPISVTIGVGHRPRTVYDARLSRPLPGGLSARLGAGEENVALGDPRLDGRLLVRCDAPGSARRLLMHPRVRQRLLTFFERHPDAEIAPDRIGFSREGRENRPVELRRDLDDLARLIQALEAARADPDYQPPPLPKVPGRGDARYLETEAPGEE